MSDCATIFRYRHDGLNLAARVYGEPGDGALPFVCLPGLTRNSRDFHAFALAVRRLRPSRVVVAFDYRGRGLSERAADAAAYTLPLETADVLAGLDALGVRRAVFVGTSRGALIIHLLALAQPALLAAAVLNDAGPKLELAGLLAIKSYVGRVTTLPGWEAATDVVERINAPTFPALKRADYERMACANLVESAEGVVADYDPRLAETLRGVTVDTQPPELWDAFAALEPMPLLVIRGEHSMLLSRETVERMKATHPSLEAIEVPGQGHAPLLETNGLPERIAAFAAAAD